MAQDWGSGECIVCHAPFKKMTKHQVMCARLECKDQHRKAQTKAWKIRARMPRELPQHTLNNYGQDSRLCQCSEKDKRSKNHWHLTERQKDVVLLLMEGNSYKEIGYKLNITTRTAMEYVKRLSLRLRNYGQINNEHNPRVQIAVWGSKNIKRLSEGGKQSEGV